MKIFRGILLALAAFGVFSWGTWYQEIAYILVYTSIMIVPFILIKTLAFALLYSKDTLDDKAAFVLSLKSNLSMCFLVTPLLCILQVMLEALNRPEGYKEYFSLFYKDAASISIWNAAQKSSHTEVIIMLPFLLTLYALFALFVDKFFIKRKLELTDKAYNKLFWLNWVIYLLGFYCLLKIN